MNGGRRVKGLRHLHCGYQAQLDEQIRILFGFFKPQFLQSPLISLGSVLEFEDFALFRI